MIITQAIALISRKQAAAALLGGDADGGGLAQLSGGSNSLLAELAKAVVDAGAPLLGLGRSKMSLEDVFRGVTYFLPAYIVCIIILMLIPEVVTFLPNLLR